MTVPERAPIPKCPLCGVELEVWEMEPAGTCGLETMRPAGAGVCSECFSRWHDAPIYRKRWEEAVALLRKAGRYPGHPFVSEMACEPFDPACLRCRIDAFLASQPAAVNP